MGRRHTNPPSVELDGACQIVYNNPFERDVVESMLM